MAKKYGRLEIEIFKEPFKTHDGARWSVVVWHMTPSYSGKDENGSGTSTSPKFNRRITAKWVAERIFTAYEMDGWDVKWKKST